MNWTKKRDACDSQNRNYEFVWIAELLFYFWRDDSDDDEVDKDKHDDADDDNMDNGEGVIKK